MPRATESITIRPGKGRKPYLDDLIDRAVSAMQADTAKRVSRNQLIVDAIESHCKQILKKKSQ